MFKLKYIIIITLITSAVAALSEERTTEPIDSLKKADIIRLLKSMGGLQIADLVVNDAMNHIQRFLPELDSAYTDELRRLIDENELLEWNAKVYDLYFTHDEIRELIKFYESPAGVRFITSLGEISNELFNNEDSWRAKINKVLYDKLKKDGYIEESSSDDDSSNDETK